MTEDADETGLQFRDVTARGAVIVTSVDFLVVLPKPPGTNRAPLWERLDTHPGSVQSTTSS
jgi:hypothetical protein